MSKNVWSFNSIVENNGFEPLTPCLQNRHSILLNYKTEGLPEDSPRSCRTYLHSLILFCLHSKKEISVQEETQPSRHLNITPLGILQKGGVPAAPSGTATLLRLSPNHESHLRRLHPQRVRPPASGATHFHDLTGGVYKARERIHRGVADPRLLATPPSWSRVADSNPN